jgi:hypothetical protein
MISSSQDQGLRKQRHSTFIDKNRKMRVDIPEHKIITRHYTECGKEYCVCGQIINGEKAKYAYEDNEGFFNDLYWGVRKK